MRWNHSDGFIDFLLTPSSIVLRVAKSESPRPYKGVVQLTMASGEDGRMVKARASHAKIFGSILGNAAIFFRWSVAKISFAVEKQRLTHTFFSGHMGDLCHCWLRTVSQWPPNTDSESKQVGMSLYKFKNRSHWGSSFGSISCIIEFIHQHY